MIEILGYVGALALVIGTSSVIVLLAVAVVVAFEYNDKKGSYADYDYVNSQIKKAREYADCLDRDTETWLKNIEKRLVILVEAAATKPKRK